MKQASLFLLSRWRFQASFVKGPTIYFFFASISMFFTLFTYFSLSIPIRECPTDRAVFYLLLSSLSVFSIYLLHLFSLSTFFISLLYLSSVSMFSIHVLYLRFQSTLLTYVFYLSSLATFSIHLLYLPVLSYPSIFPTAFSSYLLDLSAYLYGLSQLWNYLFLVFSQVL